MKLKTRMFVSVVFALSLATAEAVMKEGETIEPMFSMERVQIERAKAALRKAKLGSAAELFGKALSEGGIPAAEKKLKTLLKKRQNGPVFDENDFNNLGYQLLQENKVEFAVYIFEKNVLLYPDSWNAWDSLGEVLIKASQKERAIASYRKSLELNPGNRSAKAVLKGLETAN
jgi:tetratricopeptide (TPR) repeat protein